MACRATTSKSEDGGKGGKRFRCGSTPGSFRRMPRILLRGVKGLEGKEVAVVAARKHATWGVVPEGAASASAVDGERLVVDDGMRPPITLVDVQVDPRESGGSPMLGQADGFRAERNGWPVMLPGGAAGKAHLVQPGSIREKGGSEAWKAPVSEEEVVRDGKKQMGLFAARSFLPGDCLFVEAPLMVIPDEANIDDAVGGTHVNKVHLAAVRGFLHAKNEDKARILKMFCPDQLKVTLAQGEKRWQEEVTQEVFCEHLAKLGPKIGIEVGDFSEEDKAILWRFIRIWDANCSDVAGGIGLLGRISRANHSCNPNASRSLLPGGQMAAVAIQPIAVGEEITCSYLLDADLLKPREQRRELLAPWSFLCECGRCCGDAEERIADGDAKLDEADIQRLASKAKGGTVDLSELRSEWGEVCVTDNHWLKPQVEAGLRDLEELEGNYPAARDHQRAILKFWDDMLPAAASVHRAHLRGVLGDHERRLGNYMAALELYREGLLEVSSFQFAGHTTVQELRGKLQSLLTCEKGAKCKQ